MLAIVNETEGGENSKQFQEEASHHVPSSVPQLTSLPLLLRIASSPLRQPGGSPTWHICAGCTVKLAGPGSLAQSVRLTLTYHGLIAG